MMAYKGTRGAVVVLALALGALLASCSPDRTGGPTDPEPSEPSAPSDPGFAIVEDGLALLPEAHFAFTVASAGDEDAPDVRWRSDDGYFFRQADPTVLDGATIYVAPDAPGRYQIEAIDVADSDRRAVATVVVRENVAPTLRWRHDAHEGSIGDLALSPDGALLASGGHGGRAIIRDAGDGSIVHVSELLPRSSDRIYAGRVEAVAWSPDGEYLAYAATNYGLVVLETDGWSEVAFVQDRIHAFIIDDLAFSPDGSLLAVAAYDGLSLLEVGDWTPRLLHDEDLAVYNAVAWDATGQSLAAGRFLRDEVEIWDPAERTLVSTLSADSGVRALDWDAGSGLLAQGSDTGVRVLDVDAASTVFAYPTAFAEGRTLDLAWSPDGDRLATAHQGGVVYLWDAASWTVERELDEMWAEAVAWDADRDALFTTGADAVLNRWSLTTGAQLGSWPGEHYSAVASTDWSPAGDALLTVGSGAARVIAWDAGTGERRWTVDPYAMLAAGSWSPDGRQAAVIGFEDFGAVPIRVLDAADGSDRTPARFGHDCIAGWPDWSPDGRSLATYDCDGLLIVWDAASGAEARGTQLAPTDRGPRQVVWSPDGRYLAAARNQGLHVLDATTLEVVHELELETGVIWPSSLSWSPDADRLAYGIRAPAVVFCAVEMLDASDWTRARRLIFEHVYSLTSTAWTPDGDRLVSAGEDEVVVWDLATGVAERRMSGFVNAGRGMHVDVAPSGETFVLGAGDGR